MAQADGTIIIDTEINADGMKAGSKEVEAAVRRMAASVNDLGTKAKASLNKQVDAFAKLNSEYAAQAKKVEELKKKVAEYGNQKIPTEEYREIQSQIEQAKSRMDRLISAQEKFLAMGGSRNSKTYKQYQYDIEQLANTIKYADGELKDLEDTGKAFTFGSKTKEAAADMERLAAAERKLSDMNNRLGTSYSAIKGRVNDYQKSLLRANETQNRAETSSNRLNKSLNNTGKASRSASFGIGKMLGTSILFSFAFQAINAAIQGITGGFSNLAQYSGETNASISMLWSSLERLKNSLATAFAPILDVVAPILSKFIDMLSTAASYVSMFFAFLSGKSTYTRAVAVQKDYAASLSDTASSSGKAADAAKDNADAIKDEAEAAEDYLSPLDDINKYTEENSKNTGGGTGGGGSPGGGGGGGTGSGPLFEEVPIDNKFASLLDTVLNKLKEIRDIFMSGFWDGLGDYKPLLEELKKDLSSIGGYLTEIFTDEDVRAAAERFATSFIYNLGKIAGSFASVGLTIAVNIIGGIESYLSENVDRIKNYLIAMFDIGTEVLDTLGNLAASVADIFSTVFGSQVAQDLTGDLIGIFATIFGTVTQLAAGLGRDLLNFIAQPIIENKEAIKTALLETIAPIETIAQAIEDFVQGLSDKIMSLYNEHLKPFIDSIIGGISDIIGVFLEGYNQYIAPVLDALASKFSEVLNSHILPAFDSAMNVIGKVIDILKVLWEEVLVPFISWIVENILPIIAPIIEFLGTAALGLFGTIGDVVSGILDALGGLIDFLVGVFTGNWELAFSGLKEIGQGFLDAIQSIFDFIENDILEPFSNFLNNVFALDWEKALGIIGVLLQGFFGVVKSIWDGIKKVFEGIIDFIMGVFTGDWDRAWKGIQNIFLGIWEAVSGSFQSIIDTIRRIAKSGADKVAEIFGSLRDAIGSIFSKIHDLALRAFSYVKEKIVNPIIEAKNSAVRTLSNMRNSFVNLLNDIKSRFSSAFNSLISIVKSPINWIIRMVNSLLGKVESAQHWIAQALSFSIDLPGWAQKLTGYSSFGISISKWNLPRLPYLASGAVIPPNKEFMAVLGDQKQGNNIEAPESLIRRIVREESGNSGGTFEFVAQLNRKVIFREVIEQAKLTRIQTGKNPFELE